MTYSTIINEREFKSSNIVVEVVSSVVINNGIVGFCW